MNKSAAEETFNVAWRQLGIGYGMHREYRFHPTRKWRFDFAIPELKLAVEIEGRGRHQTVDGFRKDCEKYNAALLLGWRVLRFPATDCKQVFRWVSVVKQAVEKMMEATR